MPAHHSGVKEAAFFVGCSTKTIDVYPIRSEKEIPQRFEDNIRERGAPDQVRSDNAKANISASFAPFWIKDWQSEPHNQQQNMAENYIGKALNRTNVVMDRTGAPAKYWLLCLMYVATLLNFTANPSLNWQIPEAVLNGNTTDCWILTQFHFNEPVWYAIDNHFPSESPERPGVFVGLALNKGDQLTFKVVDDETEEILVRSVVRPKDPTRPNNRAAFIPFEGEESSPPADTPGESGDPKTFVRQAEAEGEGSNSKKGKPKAQAKKNNDNLSAAEKAKLG